MQHDFEEELKHNSILRCLYENSHVNSILILDENGYILHLNKAFQQTYGFTPDDLYGKHGRILFTEEDRSNGVPEREIERTKKHGFTRDRNFIVHHDGHPLWTDGESILIKSDTGAVYIFKIVQAIEEQLILETFLRDALAFSDNILDSINDGLMIINREKKVLRINAALHKILSEDDRVLEGKYLHEVTSSVFTSADFNRELDNVLQDGYVHELVFQTKTGDGTDRTLSIKMKLLQGQEPAAKILVIIEDITEREATRLRVEKLVHVRTRDLAIANEHLRVTNEQLQRSNYHLDQFAYAASHDLKEPVRKIRVFLSQFGPDLQAKLDHKEKKILEKIGYAAERMTRLIDDMLLYSQVHEQGAEKEFVDLNAQVQQVLEDLEPDIRKKEVQVQVGPLPVVHGFSRQLRQLFQNLISNAIKFSRNSVRPLITISSSIAEVEEILYHLITVQDNGIGFEQQYADKIYQLFTRLHGTNEYEGTGIGLTIVRKVMENHNGFVRAQSAMGTGATFKLYLPSA